MNNKDIESAKRVLSKNLAVKSNETVLILIDASKKDFGDIFYTATEELGAEVILMQYQVGEKSGEEPSPVIREAMKMVDVAVCITEHSISHTMARKEASKHMTRMGTMPGLTKEMLAKGALNADYTIVENRGNALKKVLDEGKEVLIITGNYRLAFSIDQRVSKASNGLLINPGDSGNLPSGETFIAPVEGTANGEIMIDGSIAGIGLLKKPIVLTLKDGRLISAEGGSGKKLLSILGEEDGRCLGELGIGTNDYALMTGNILEDEKIYGTCHVAFGTNSTFGGIVNAGVHIDAVTMEPEILIDGSKVLSNGQLHI